ncbi:MAG: hypothetical protein EAZ30_17345 [Betaproteobacteria bacterium]|nr:MAG: hypothetical protein EAZ30_17345 [Betaproteobacteria bacterium]
MTMQLDLWHLILLLTMFLGACAGAGKLLLDQLLRRMDERFEAQDTTAAANQRQVAHRLEGLEAASRAERDQWQRVERELLNLKAELPLHYVRREDYVQAVATIMAKLDAMALRFENILLRGKNQ